MIFHPEIWKTHNRKSDFIECPHCGKPLQWIYDGVEWHPCDKEPVMFILHPNGKNTVIYKRETYENALMYKKDDKRFEGIHPLYGNIPHYYTCEVLREHRKAFALKKRKDYIT